MRVILLLLWKHHLVSLLQNHFFSSPPCFEVPQKGHWDGFAIFPSLRSRLGEDSEELQGSGVVAREALTGGDGLDVAPREWGHVPTLSSPAGSALVLQPWASWHVRGTLEVLEAAQRAAGVSGTWEALEDGLRA